MDKWFNGARRDLWYKHKLKLLTRFDVVFYFVIISILLDNELFNRIFNLIYSGYFKQSAQLGESERCRASCNYINFIY